MVNRITLGIAALAVLVLFANPGAAHDPQRDVKARAALGMTQPVEAERDRKARVALALAEVEQVAVAPAPKPKICPCGDDCKCTGGCPVCPATATSQPSAPASVVAPVSPQPKLVGYRQVCSNGRCYLIPIYEP